MRAYETYRTWKSEKRCNGSDVHIHIYAHTKLVRETFILIMYEWLKVYGFRTPKMTPRTINKRLRKDSIPFTRRYNFGGADLFVYTLL